MVFSSNIFLFGFLPLFFSIYFLMPLRLRNGFLLLASLLFYAYGAGPIVAVLLGSIIGNHIVAKMLGRIQGKTRHLVFIMAVAANIATLLYYKYTGFLWDAGNDASHGKLAAYFPKPHVALPIGISFFTFQAVSYIADIYSGYCRPARKLADFAMYHSLFPQLIAGPIVRYVEIEQQITTRSTSAAMATEGAMRFIAGLAKKLIIADNVGLIADQIFRLGASDLTPALAWLGAVSYTIQILFDFSGYSDMAIGLGLLLGFRFPENFDRPYQSENITEFWRRWHMTLSRWFRDYVYIPLGGNRCGTARTYLNLVAVFFLCGLWHGAGYTFIVWGLYHGMLLVIERVMHTAWGIRPHGLWGRLWTLVAVVIGWVFFRAETIHQALDFLSAMFLLAPALHPAFLPINFLPPDRLFYLAAGIAFALIPFGRPDINRHNAAILLMRQAASLALLAYSVLLLSANTFNPFIYFRF